MFGRLFKGRQEAVSAPLAPAIPAGQRVYAVGDIHGRLDLLDQLLDAMDQDDAARAEADHHVIFLGDLVDRGPSSAGVVERLMEIGRNPPNVRFLMGNHEEVMLLALEGNREALRLFDKIGGRETMLSYGVPCDQLRRADFDTLQTLLQEAVPEAHVEFLRSFEDMITIGDYVFVHAGVNPNSALDRQRVSDLRWIREKFLDHDGQMEKVVVHGHTITRDVDWRSNRIGIDTGAYLNGRLTALGLERDLQWLVQVQDEAIVATAHAA